ncbi:Protease 2 [Corynebacterium glaucum]|uniref:Protease 2 n=1 Tax=Corynebacterium glaucum TaxID=187491 RepID=A0A1Q2HYZ0_9CORY|nr:S9 family peptidase [Corynebacterium glaucum]AQQ16043.1 Protease 2 [Corynebacterium glaucum]
MTAPKAPIRPIVRTFHGREFTDNYEWLREKDNPEVIAHLEAENAYTQQMTAGLEGLTDAIYGEIKLRIKETDMSVPQCQGDWWYYGRVEEGKSYGISCRVPVKDDPWTPPEIVDQMPGEQVLLDANELAEGHDFFSMGASSVSTSGRLLAYSTDTEGDERFTLRIKDLQNNSLFDDCLTDVFYGATWAGEDYIFYVRVDDAWRPYQVWRHKVGTAESEDVLVYQEDDEKFAVGVNADRAERYLYILASSSLTSEYRVVPLTDPTAEFEVLWAREAGVEYHAEYAEVGGAEYWVVTHNTRGPNFAVSVAPVASDSAALPDLRDLNVVVPHSETMRVEGTDVYRDFIFLSYRREGISRLAVSDLTGGDFGAFNELEFDEELYTAGFVGHPEWDAPVVRISYTSFTQPSQVLDYTVATGQYTLLKEQEVQGGYDADEYEAFRLWATADDGAEVPISVVRKKGVEGPAPLLLYGYGSYEASTDPGFSIARLSLLDRGMIWACAHVRGGGEMGRTWYDHGKMLHKKNTFTDFVACADKVVELGLTTHDRMVAEGGSAGGLLMGAVANLAPEKFAGIQAIVPFVDPLTSILKPELPLTVGEWEEWGDPYHDAEVYDYMAGYAPYENVEAKEYPAILAVTSLNDTRVLYVEPAKWIAKLREVATGGPFLLKTEMSAGHGGVSGRYAKWKQTAFEYAWTLATSGAVSDAAESVEK